MGNLPVIARDLAARRAALELPLAALSAQTRINPEYLAQLEAGNFTFLPPAYVFSMLQRYAKLLDIDASLVDRCRAELGLTAETPLVPALDEGEEKKLRRYAVAKRVLQVGAALALSAAGFFAGQTFLSADTEVVIHKTAASLPVYAPVVRSEPAAVPAPVNVVPAPETAAGSTSLTPSAPMPKPSGAAGSQLQPVIPSAKVETRVTGKKKLSLMVRAKTDSCWLQIAPDKTAPKEAYLFPHQTKFFEADSVFSITLGRAQAVDILLNGKPVSLGQHEGPVYNLMLTERQ